MISSFLSKIFTLSLLLLFSLFGLTQTIQAGVAPTPAPIPTLTPTSTASATINIQNFQFNPQQMTITPGTTIIWVNKDSEPHTTTIDDTRQAESWDSGTIAPGQSFSKTFTQIGTYNYHCTIHPSMKGTIQVIAGSQPGIITQQTAPPAIPPGQLPSTGTSEIIFLTIAGITLVGFKLAKLEKVAKGKTTADNLWYERHFKLPM